MKSEIRVGTRGSQLALWQANWVKSSIEERYAGTTVELVKIKTTGDKILDVPLAQVGGKGLFVKEIEEALLDGRVDLAVHSMKDVPTEFPEGLHLAYITEREDPRDIVISRNGIHLFDLPQGAKIGTASLRRQAQILKRRPDFEIVQLRGNLDTRIRKLTETDMDAIILAGAGIKRLGWAEKITEYLEPEVMLPAIGQGALGIETRIDDEEINELTTFFNHHVTAVAVRAERALLKRLEGGCQVPIAAYGTVDGGRLTLAGLVASTDGEQIIQESLDGDEGDAETVGIALAERLLARGAGEILAEVYGKEPGK
ncbi:MAG: hydroxymethylbilane synthase [Deltaproteobacteria bacterium]|nr:hydroxymethylbilane synthase [Deltaproteobacteria bacterium]